MGAALVVVPGPHRASRLICTLILPRADPLHRSPPGLELRTTLNQYTWTEPWESTTMHREERGDRR